MKMQGSKEDIEQMHHNSEIQLEPLKIFECRICLQIGSEDLEALVSPCRCAGSLKFVHTSCIKKWIEKMVENSKKDIEDSKAFICCEICKAKIFFQASSSLSCRDSKQIGQAFKESYKLFIALLLLLITNLGFFSALLNYLVFVGFRTLKQNNVVLVSLIISGQVIFSIVSLVTLGAIAKRFFLKNNLVVELIPNKSVIKK